MNAMVQIPDLEQQTITTVQLPSSSSQQRLFLTKMQAALGSQGGLSSLMPGPSVDVFVIPHVAQWEIMRQLNLLDEDAFSAQLVAWGALTVNQLRKSAFIALLTRGATVVDDVLVSPPKLVHATPAPQQAAVSVAFLPSDFHGPYDWQIDERGVNAVAAWRMFAAKPEFANALPWANIRIGHVDTGYSEHAALGWQGGASHTVQPHLGQDFWEGDHDSDGPRDPFLPGFPGHGTRISAAIAGFYPQAVSGPFYGVAPGVQIIPYRVTDSVLIDHVLHHVCDAMDDAVANGCHVVNISLGALRASRSLAAALDRAYEQGCIVVCAAGQVWGEVIYPGRFNRCMTMGGVGLGLKPWRSAAKGIYVDLCGPADGIRRIKALNAAPGNAGSEMESGFGDGTSYATAACSGAAALWLAWHGVAKLRAHYATSGLWQIPRAFKLLACQSARAGAWTAAETNDYGSGVLDVAALLSQPLPPDGSMRIENAAYGVFDDGL
jgi:lambda repressor-like predicted transcriptional regulator